MNFKHSVELVAKGLDIAGVLAVVLGILFVTALFLRDLRTRSQRDGAYRAYRSGIGRAILLSLEFLVAADIIRTIAIRPTFEGVGVLALIVLVRTFLSMALELEVEGRWPWQQRGGVPAAR